MYNFPINLIVGLKLSIWRRAANMINIQFGMIQKTDMGSIGQFGFHIQCPFRLVHKGILVTGNSDLYEPRLVTDDFDWEKWYDDSSWNDNLMEFKIIQLLKGFDIKTNSIVNISDNFFVQEAYQKPHGDISIIFDDNSAIEIFTNGSVSEHYRLLDHATKTHYVYPREQ